MALIPALAALACAAGCVGGPKTPPSWYADAQQNHERGYPSLREVPKLSDINDDDQHWSAMAGELRAAGAEVRAHPRSRPLAEPSDPGAFVEDARRELEEARQAHEP